MFGSFRSPDSGQVSGANSTQQSSNSSPFTQSASGGSLFSAQQNSGSSPFTQSAFAGSGGGFNQSPSPEEQTQQSGNAPQQQQQSASGFSFGSQKAPQQQSMQTGGGLFGQAAPQQTSFSFGQQQQPIQQSARARRYGQPGFGKQWSLEGSAPSSRLEWVSTKDGTIPLDAVEGGWCSKTQEPYYIARCTTNQGCLAYGYALKSTSICYCDTVKYNNVGPVKIHSSSSFEVLVNPDGIENLSWVPLFDSFYDKTVFITPTNPFGFNDDGKIVYIGRTFASKAMDSVPGICRDVNGLSVCIEEADSTSWKKFTPQGFEVLCRVGDVGSNRAVKQCYLYDVEYSDVEKTCDMEYIIMSSTVLQNNCSEVQRFQWNPLQLNPTQQLTDDKIEGLLWDIGRDMKHKCEIKAAVPYASHDDDETLSISYTKIGELPLGFNKPPNYGGFGFRAPVAAMNELVQSIDDDESQPGILGKPAAHIVLGKMARKSGIGQQSFGFMSAFGPANEGFHVPGNSKIKVGISGCKKTVMVTFTGKLKTVYGNNLVEDEEVKGTFTGVYLTSIVRTVLDQLLLSS